MMKYSYHSSTIIPRRRRPASSLSSSSSSSSSSCVATTVPLQLILLLVAVLSCVTLQEVNGLLDPAVWRIDDPTFTVSNKSFHFIYGGIHPSIDIVRDASVTFYEYECSEAFATTEGPWNAPQFLLDNLSKITTTTDGWNTNSSIADLQFTTVPKEIALTPMYVRGGGDDIDGDGVGQNDALAFCVRFSLAPNAEGYAINFVETQVKISMKMDGTYDVDSLAITPYNITSSTSNQTYSVEAVLCDGAPPYKQGDPITVCVQPKESAKYDGIVMDAIDSFTWQRDGLQQIAVSERNDNHDTLTQLQFSSDDNEIKISSVIYASFYASDGNVTAIGSATMKFPTAAVLCEPQCKTVSNRGERFPEGTTAEEFRDAITYWIENQESVHGNNINCWDIRNVTDMTGAFEDRELFTYRVDCWDMKYVTTIDRMFKGATLFDVGLNGWKTRRMTSMESTFENARDYDQDMSLWDTSKVTTMKQMFKDTPSFTQDINTWDTSQVTDMSMMFSGALNFASDLCDWDIASTATTNYMFVDTLCPDTADPTSANICHTCDDENTRYQRQRRLLLQQQNNEEERERRRMLLTWRELQDIEDVGTDPVSGIFDVNAGVQRLGEDGPQDLSYSQLHAAGRNTFGGVESIKMTLFCITIAVFGILVTS